MNNLGIKLALFINYFVFAILLNSVGIVIKQSLANYGVTETEASILEAFKDLPIAIVSFFVASFLPKFGYKNSMLLALALVFGACLYGYLHYMVEISSSSKSSSPPYNSTKVGI